MSCTRYAPYDCIWYLFHFLQGKCTTHSFALCSSHSSPLLLSLSCRRLTALSCKSMANQSNKEPQQICLRRRRWRRRGQIDWWGWGAWDWEWDWPNGRLLIWPSCDWIVVTPTCLPNIQTRSLSRIAVMTFSTDWILCWLQIKIATFSSDIDNNAFEHYLLCCCPLAPNSHFHSLTPLSVSLSLSQSICASRSLAAKVLIWLSGFLTRFEYIQIAVYIYMHSCVCVCRHRTYS